MMKNHFKLLNIVKRNSVAFRFCISFLGYKLTLFNESNYFINRHRTKKDARYLYI